MKIEARQKIAMTILVLSVIASVISFGISQDFCNDVWAHALNGKVMLEKGRLPKFSDYSFVQGQDVDRVQWSCALMFYFLLKVFGYPGLLLFKIFVLAGTVLFLALLFREKKIPPGLAACSCACFMLVGHSRFLPRGDMLNLLFTTFFFYILSRHRRKRDRIIWLLPFAELLWIQFHDLANLGSCMALIFACQGLWSKRNEEKADRDLNRRVYFAVACLCFFASFINVMTYHNALSPFRILWKMDNSQRELYEVIGEFFPILFYTGKMVIAPLPILLEFAVPFLVLAGLLYANRKIVFLPHVLLFIGFSLAASRFRRFLGLYAVVISPLLFIYLWEYLKTRFSIEKVKARSLVCGVFVNILLTALVVSNILYRWERRPVRCEPSLSPLSQPIRAVNFIEKKRLYSNICNDYNVGGFVGYRLYPKNKIFVHSLALWYSYDHFLLVKNMLKGNLDLQLLARDFQIGIFLVMYNDPYQFKNIKKLSQSSWKLVYLDDLSAVYVDNKRFPSIKQLRLDKFIPNEKTVISPNGFYALGNFCMAVEEYDKAEEFFRRTLDLEICRAGCYYGLGHIAKRKGQSRKALEYFVASARIEPSTEALEEIEKLIERIPANDGLYRQALKLYVKEKR